MRRELTKFCSYSENPRLLKPGLEPKSPAQTDAKYFILKYQNNSTSLATNLAMEKTGKQLSLPSLTVGEYDWEKKNRQKRQKDHFSVGVLSCMFLKA